MYQSRNQSQSEDSCLLNTDRGVDHDGGVILIKGVIFVQGTTTTTATNNFSDGNKLGEGGFGVVYKGQLEDGQRIAVKKLSRNSSQAKSSLLNWQKCLEIIIGISRGLLYLHQDSILKAIHRDLKPSNILLEDMIPKISNFEGDTALADGTTRPIGIL
ncbi:hypothetical protein ZIOFF_025165 [Zingiber officinale]|uniref:non-specific serine/threonine protein kinase n=1 Tax=Zingiber officinale TaxID=94328 RepID=A0A8J5GTJ5_ZINOF|nr:hypothetical protein ZIOFF_025165 [Zingiber officinale]